MTHIERKKRNISMVSFNQYCLSSVPEQDETMMRSMQLFENVM